MIRVAHALHRLDVTVAPVLFDVDDLVVRRRAIFVGHVHRARCLRSRRVFFFSGDDSLLVAQGSDLFLHVCVIQLTVSVDESSIAHHESGYQC